MCQPRSFLHHPRRFGLGLILQVKVRSSAPSQAESVESRPKRRSLLRRMSSRLIGWQSTRSRRSTKYHRGGDGLNEISEGPLSPAPSPKSPVSLRRQLSRRITRLFSDEEEEASSERKPRYDMAPLHLFMKEVFPGSVTLEEHQVRSSSSGMLN